MNFLELIFKQMRQRTLSTWLTLISVMLGVGLAVAVMILQRAGNQLFGQSDFGYEIILGPPKGSPLQLVLNTAYHIDRSYGNIPYQLYEDMIRRHPAPGRPYFGQYVRIAIPFMVGDSFHGRRIVGTSPQMFGFDDQGEPVKGEVFEYRKDRRFELAEGRIFNPGKFEAVIGSDVAQREHMGVGSTFQATHGMPQPGEIPDIHKPVWTVVGVLKPTHTANDRVLFIPVISLYAIEEHDKGLIEQALMKDGFEPGKIPPDKLKVELLKLGFDPDKLPKSLVQELATEGIKPEGAEDADAYHLDAKGDIVPDLPREDWQISAILVKTRSMFSADQLLYNFQVTNREAVAVNPASVMRDFFETFMHGSTMVLLVIALLVTVVAAVSILVSIYNSVSARRREIAILRTLGATRRRILAMICGEAALVGLLGGICGLILGHLVGAAESYLFNQKLGQTINWLNLGTSGPFYVNELLYLVLVVVIAFLAGLVPAIKAYATPVATNLVSD